VTREDRATCEGPGCDITFVKSSWNQKFHDGDCKRSAENERNRRAYTQDVADALAKTVAPAYLDEVDEESQLNFLRREVTRLGRLVDKYKSSKSEMVEAVYQAVTQALDEATMPTVPKPPRDTRNNDEEVAVAVLADWQLGKKTPTYNSEICRERIDSFADQIIRSVRIQRADHPVRHIRLWALGDIVEGEDIFAGQAHLIDSSLYRQVGINGPEIIRDFILKMLTEFDTVHFVGVIGNHGAIGGRARKDYNSETNMDRLLYKIVEHMFAYEPRVTFDIPDGDGESNFYAVDTIGEYGTLLLHGNQFPAPTSSHTYYKKVMGWKDGAIEEPFEDVFAGHYHQNTKMTLGNTILRISPSPESYNTFAQEVLAVMGRPAQHLQYVHPRYGVTSEQTIYLDL
jgi:hypothetical protein